MGSTLSHYCVTTRRSRVNREKWTAPPGDHSPYPIDRMPYEGPKITYCFVDISVSFKIMKNVINLGPAAVTTDVERYIDLLTEFYDDGFTLDKFVRVPTMNMTTDVNDWVPGQLYQAILTKPEVTITTKERWELHVEKRILSTKTLAFDQLDHENDLLNTINNYACRGARLVCAEPIGYVRSPSPNEQYSVMGIELFFNVPLHRLPTRYTYHTAVVSAQYSIVPDSTQSVQQVLCNADFLGQLRLFLNKGWRLVDICIDVTAIADAYKSRSSSKTVETIWVFEKEVQRIYNDEPVYEGVIIEYLHRVKMTLGKEEPSTDWRSIIAGMGVNGWQLAAIVQTPLLLQTTFTTYTMKLLFIFQRPIIARHIAHGAPL